MLPSLSSSPYIQQEATIQSFIEELQYQLSFHTPSTALQNAINHTNTQAIASGQSQLFDNFQSSQSIFQDDPVASLRQSRLSIFRTGTKVRIRRIQSVLTRISGQPKEVTIGTGSFSITFDIRRNEEFCYVEYVSVKQCWRVATCPSDIPLRVLEDTEFTPGCQQLILLAGCVFKTLSTTPIQYRKPVDVPARSLRAVMRSTGFFVADSGTLHRLYASRIGRSINAIVAIIPQVDQYGENRFGEVWVENRALIAEVVVMVNQGVTDVINGLRAQSRNCVITLNGRDVVKKKFTGRNSIILI